MEEEKLITGYCRTQDQSRMIWVVYRGQELLEADCLYPDCPFRGSCEVAKAIDRLLDTPG